MSVYDNQIGYTDVPLPGDEADGVVGSGSILITPVKRWYNGRLVECTTRAPLFPLRDFMQSQPKQTSRPCPSWRDPLPSEEKA